ncbi:hypothetical protein NSA56_11220 [Oceanobacillus caeni]|uniref:phage tail protein n=1 Tax=Oceanobacillus caeni TaxID=405946 RepID=UPI00214A7339|nr:hypothetical protein [Oceanobacillus caeni]MCR1834965.1 hypothetical protein [Oceanobacillus caeni]
MTELYIFSQDDKPLTIITEDTGLVSAPVRIEVNSVPDTPFSFTVEADSENAQYVKEENKVVYRDHEGDLRLVVIKELDDSDGIDGPLTTAICEPEFMELTEHIVVDRRIIEGTAQKALDAVLEGTRYIGEVEVDLGLATTNFYYIDSVESIWKIIKTWGGEFKDVVEFDDKNHIIARKIKLLQRLGKDHGQRFEIDHNITEINRTVLSYPLTAMYGRGASLEIEDEEGNHTGGYSRYIDFADVEWKKSKGDPVDKPKGQLWVGDLEALAVYGRPHNGTKLHRYGIFSNQDYEDPEELLWATWQNLQENKRPEINYQLSVDLFNDKVSLGDTAVAIDRYFSRPIEIQARVIAMEYDLLDIDGTMIVEMGQFLNLEDNRLDEIERDVENLKNRRPSNRVTEDSYPDVKPGTPVNLRAEGGIEVIQLYWDYDSSIYVKQYEVYGSQVKDFIPDSQHLLWRGDVSAFAHTVGTDQVWYYRVRAVNYQGTASEYSVQVSASTHRVISDDILFGEDLAAKLRDLSKVSDLLAEDTISFDQISEQAKGLIKQESKIYTDAEIQAIENRLLDDLANKAGLAYVDGQLQLKADADTVSAVQRDITNLETKANDLRANVTNIVTDLSDLRTSVNTDIAGLNSTADKLLKRVADNEEALKANGGKITSIEQEVDTVKGSLSTTINQLSSIDGVVSEHTVAINANTEAIKFKASQDSVDTLTGQISAVEGSIETLAGKVSLKAEAKDVYTKSEVNTALGKKVDTTTYDKKMSQLDISIDGINASVSSIQSSVSDVDSRLEKAQAQLDVLPGQINAKAEKNSVYTKTETDGRISSEISSAKAEIKVTTDGISQEVSKVDSKIDGLELDGRNLLIGSKELVDSFPNKVSHNGLIYSYYGYAWGFIFNVDLVKGQTYTVSVPVYNSNETTSTQARIYVGHLDNMYRTLEPLESQVISITFTAQQDEPSAIVRFLTSTTGKPDVAWHYPILQRGNKFTGWQPAPEDVDGAISNVQSYASSIDQKADSIQSSVSSLQSTVNSHGSKITSAQTKIDQNTTAISQRAIKTDVDKALKGKVDTTTYTKKVGELTTSINGISGRVSNTESSINSLTGEVSSAKSQIASLDVKANSIVQSVSEVRADLNGLEIGGRNLIPDSEKRSWGGSSTSNFSYVIFYRGLEKNQTYTVSFEAELTGTGDKNYITVYPYLKDGQSMSTIHVPYKADERMSATFTTDDRYNYNLLIYAGKSGGTAGNKIILKKLQLEKGNKATDWQPAPEDVDSRMTKAESSITQLADDILLKVNKDDLISEINLRPKGVRIKGSLIELDGTTLIRDGIIGTAAIANAAITKAKLGTAVVGTAQIENGAITNAKIANATIDDAKIANVSVTKLLAGTIDTSKIKIRGGSATDYTEINGSTLTSRGQFRRTWRGSTETHDVTLRLRNGYFRAENPSKDRAISIADFGISTFADGNGGGSSSGTIEFFSRRFSNVNGLTMYSSGTYGVDASEIISQSVYAQIIESNESQIYFRPNRTNRPGNNTFQLSVLNENQEHLTDGILAYGSTATGYTSGLRFSKRKAEPVVWVVNGDLARYSETKIGAGYFMGYMAMSHTGENFYIGSSSETRSVNSTAYQNGKINYIPHRADSFPTGSSERFKTDIVKYEESALEQLRNSVIYEYTRRASQVRELGFIIEREIPEVVKFDDESVNGYTHRSLNTKAIQELDRKVEDEISWLKTENQLLKNEVSILENKIKQLEEKVA